MSGLQGKTNEEWAKVLGDLATLTDALTPEDSMACRVGADAIRQVWQFTPTLQHQPDCAIYAEPAGTCNCGIDLFREIMRERANQDRKWGGPAHDDKHTEVDWQVRLEKHARRLTTPVRSDDKDDFFAGGHDEMEPADDYRLQLIQSAALAIAALQAFDRADLSENGEPV